MWIKNFVNECRAWHIVRKVYRQNKSDFDAIGIKSDWFGKLYKVINRDTEIELGSGEDEIYLRKELSEITQLLIKHNIVDILAYELKPLENETMIDDNTIEYEHAYLVVFTPAWKLDRQYVTFKSVLAIIIVLFLAVVFGISIITSFA